MIELLPLANQIAAQLKQRQQTVVIAELDRRPHLSGAFERGRRVELFSWLGAGWSIPLRRGRALLGYHRRQDGGDARIDKAVRAADGADGAQRLNAFSWRRLKAAPPGRQGIAMAYAAGHTCIAIGRTARAGYHTRDRQP